MNWELKRDKDHSIEKRFLGEGWDLTIHLNDGIGNLDLLESHFFSKRSEQRESCRNWYEDEDRWREWSECRETGRALYIESRYNLCPSTPPLLLYCHSIRWWKNEHTSPFQIQLNWRIGGDQSVDRLLPGHLRYIRGSTSIF